MSTALPVLHVVVSTRAGGGPQHVLALGAGLRARGWRPLVAGPHDGPLFEIFEACGMEPVAVATHRARPLSVARLARLIRRRGVRLVHTHGKGAGLYGRLAARAAGVPAVHTFHGIHFERYGRWRRPLYLALERLLAKSTQIVVNVSRAQEAEGLALRLFSAAQSRVIVNGVDAARLNADALERWEARETLGLPQQAPVVGCAARFDAVKRLDVLLRAAAGLPQATVALIGGGPEEARLRALAAELGLGRRIVFAGEIPQASRLFRAFDVYAAPSRKEGMPLGVLEAMALGVAVVASDIPAHREVLGEASPGLTSGEVEPFRRRLQELLADPERRAALGAENRTRARSEFDAREMVAAVDGVYREALGL